MPYDDFRLLMHFGFKYPLSRDLNITRDYFIELLTNIRYLKIRRWNLSEQELVKLKTTIVRSCYFIRSYGYIKLFHHKPQEEQCSIHERMKIELQGLLRRRTFLQYLKKTVSGFEYSWFVSDVKFIIDTEPWKNNPFNPNLIGNVTPNLANDSWLINTEYIPTQIDQSPNK
jgi:hypothetical protein